MTKKTLPVTVHILEKEYRIACPPEEREALICAATYLSDRMDEVRDNSRLVGFDRIAVMAALNIAHEMFKQRSEKPTEDMSHIMSRIRKIQDKVDNALNEGRQIQIQ